jgi:membrane protease subunit (stomatin/prohibitin family)
MAIMMEIIEWFDQTGEEIVHRIPEEGSADIKFGAQLVVRENQAAIFFRDGKGLDVFGPGRHTLSTLNLPVLTRMLSLPWGFKSPFRCEVYFVNMKVFTTMKWGTKDPVAFRDSELGMVRLRAFGNFTMKVTQPLLFVNAIVGTMGIYTSANIQDYLRDVIVSRINDLLGEQLDTIFNLPENYDELGVAVKMRLVDDFRKYGMDLVDFFVNAITPPEEVQRMIDERSSMGAVGDMNRFMQFRAAKAVGDAVAGGEGGGGDVGGPAAAGMGLGVGAGLGMMVPGFMMQAMHKGAAAPQPHEEKMQVVQCPKCQGALPVGARFCPNCGSQMVVEKRCPKCSRVVPAEANFCLHCGSRLTLQETKCGKCGAELPDGARFCTECGEKAD